MKVYRGLKLTKTESIECGKINYFMSTSSDQRTAKTFAGKECCLITLDLVNTPAVHFFNEVNSILIHTILYPDDNEKELQKYVHTYNTFLNEDEILILSNTPVTCKSTTELQYAVGPASANPYIRTIPFEG